jgi:SAM-dependent methyltransferase
MSELAGDPAYESVVTPLLFSLFTPEADSLYLDIGCGEGRMMRRVREEGARAHGVDVNPTLAAHDPMAVVAMAQQLPMRSAAYVGVYSVLTLEHISECRQFMAEAARVTKPGGCLVVIVNHPIWTAPGSTPISDSDGEALWRPGDYFSDGSTDLPAGDGTITFHHRPMSDLLNAAAEAGWSLEQMIEQPHHEFDDQAGIPRLLACRWRLLP